MKKRISFLTICTMMVIFSISFTACKEDSDTTKPVINLIEPEEGDILQIGNEEGVHFDVELSDNEMLASYKVDIHPNFDNHSHTKSTDETVDFEFAHSWDISGKKNADIHHHEILIPENATPGNYHLVVYCTDAAGNESHVAVNVVLSHEADEHHDD
jgi:hypothetical protein